jgi:hypothetical protein
MLEKGARTEAGLGDPLVQVLCQNGAWRKLLFCNKVTRSIVPRLRHNSANLIGCAPS